MRKLLLIILLALTILAHAEEELKVTTLSIARVNYENGMIGPTIFRILCVNGYKWLNYSDSHGSTSQMFQNNVMNGNAQAIPCKNKEQTNE